MERNSRQNTNRDSQLERLAGQLRDQGVAPERDLWPDINAAIDRETRRPGLNRWRLGAVAAALLLMLTAGWLGLDAITHEGGPADLAGDSEDGPSGLAVIDRALAELNLAMAEDPGNGNLSQLVLMVHQTRGHLLRKNSDKLLNE